MVPYETFFWIHSHFTEIHVPNPVSDWIICFLFCSLAKGKNELDAVFFSPLVLFSNSCFFGVCLAGDFIVLEFSCFPL